MASVKERFESIMNDGAVGESEALKICVSYNKELQKEISKLKEDAKGSKLDRMIDTWLAWSREAPAEGRFAAHVGAAIILTACLWAVVAIGLWTLDSYKEFKSDVPLSSEGYFMSGDSETVDGKSVNCYQIQFMRGNGSTYDAAPCIVNRDEAFNVLAKLQEIWVNGKPQANRQSSPSEATPSR